MEIKKTESTTDVIIHLQTLSPELRQEVYHYIDFLRTRHIEATKQKKTTSTADIRRPANRIEKKITPIDYKKEPLENFEDVFSMQL